MPKSAKKRKDKAADFSKSKLKLGKGKQLASNAIDTSFKARSIALPSQSITKDKDNDEPTTKRRLTFDELVAHSKHYSAGTRKDAIMGFRELLEAHPEILQPSLTTLFGACARLIGDEESSVRKALLAFFSWLLPKISQEQISPHAPTLLLFTTSAQTHIFPEIRIDAIKFLDLLLECTPDSVVSGWNESSNQPGKRVLEGYLGLLSAGTKYGDSEGPLKATSTASVVLTAASKLVVLRSLSTFIRKAFELETTNNDPHWYLASSFATKEACLAFNTLLRPVPLNSLLSQREWAADYDYDTLNEDFVVSQQASSSSHLQPTGGLYLGSMLDITEFGSSAPSHEVFNTHLARVLHSTLVSTFLDCSPVVFSPAGNPPETELHLVQAISEIARSIYGAILQDPSNLKGKSSTPIDDLSNFLGHMAPFFPFVPSGRRDIKIEQAFQELNISFCELSSLLSSAYQEASGSSRAGGSILTRNETVRGYILGALDTDSPSLRTAAYTSLLPTIWSLLNANNSSNLDVVLDAVIRHAISLSARSALKGPATEFMCLLILLDMDVNYSGHFRIGKHMSKSTLENFIEELPKTLWELGNGNVALTEMILRFLLRFQQRGVRTLTDKVNMSLRTRLMPYFTIVHATRGSIPGPFTKLPGSRLRRLALDLAATIMLPGDGLCEAVASALSGSNDENYWCSIT